VTTKKAQTLTAWRAVHPDLRSSNGYVWPFPGHEAVAPLPDGEKFTKGNACPTFVGDGLCLAKTWAGAASGGIPAITCLEVTFDPTDVLGEDGNKVRVSRCQVVAIFDASLLIRDGWLKEGNLDGANLYRASLDGANLDRANLNGASLDGANLDGANLDGASLYRANLNGANLYGANLYGANLDGASLYRANLYRANLNGANLDRANLNSASHDEWTCWPHGFDVGRLG
jgi:hypothetical protein